MKKFIIIGIVGVVLLVVWSFVTRVDRSNPHEVAEAYLDALKSNNLDRASGYWIPSDADAWRKRAREELELMQSGSFRRFFEDIPGDPQFTRSERPDAAENERTLVSGDTAVHLREIDGAWYVFRGPI